jgi:hypothetical protein
MGLGMFVVFGGDCMESDHSNGRVGVCMGESGWERSKGFFLSAI